jgi:FkbM family methyltransferase
LSNIHVVHVGGRGGLGPLSKLLKFAPGIIDLTLIEAFLEDGEPITSNNKLRKLCSHREIKACIWSKEEERDFYIAASPMASSLLPTEESAKDYIMKSGRWGDVCKTVKTIKVQTTTLDKLEFHAPVDFLSMDIQGAEFESLRGAKTLLKNVISLLTECEHVQLYRGQGLIGDQKSLLSKFGIKYVRSLKHGNWSLNGNKDLVWSECLWSKTVKAIVNDRYIDTKDKCLKLIKLAIILLSFQMVTASNDVCDFINLSMQDELEHWKQNSQTGLYFSSFFKQPPA